MHIVPFEANNNPMHLAPLARASELPLVLSIIDHCTYGSLFDVNYVIELHGQLVGGGITQEPFLQSFLFCVPTRTLLSAYSASVELARLHSPFLGGARMVAHAGISATRLAEGNENSFGEVGDIYGHPWVLFLDEGELSLIGRVVKPEEKRCDDLSHSVTHPSERFCFFGRE
jgi:hypothetical protein